MLNYTSINLYEYGHNVGSFTGMESGNIEVKQLDKYEYRLKTEEMLKCVAAKDYKKAETIADSIDWRRVKSVSMAMIPRIIVWWTGDWAIRRTSGILPPVVTRRESRSLWTESLIIRDGSFSRSRIFARTGRVPRTATGTNGSTSAATRRLMMVLTIAPGEIAMSSRI